MIQSVARADNAGWKLQNGVATADGSGAPLLFDRSKVPNNFEISCEILPGGEELEAGIVFRSTSEDKGYFAVLQPYRHQVVLKTLGTGREIATAPLITNPDNRYEVHLRVYRDHLRVDVNQLPLIDTVDDEFSTGSAGVYARSGNAGFEQLKASSYRENLPSKTFTNSLMGRCADPCVLRYGGRYYVYCTYPSNRKTGESGIGLYSSTDLVHWKDHGFALKREDSWGNANFWAPAALEKDGVFYLYYSAETQVCVATADSPEGPFKQEIQKPLLKDQIRIDPYILKDDDGQYYIYYVHFGNGNEIWGARLNDDMMSVDESSIQPMIKPDQPWERNKAPVTEGPEIIKHNGLYYMTYSGSHFESPDYSVGYAVSDSPLGPWKKYENNPILRKTAAVHGPGHHCLTESPDGKERFIIYHCHKEPGTVSPRKMAIDRYLFVPQENGPDVMIVHGPTSSPQPMPSGAR